MTFYTNEWSLKNGGKPKDYSKSLFPAECDESKSIDSDEFLLDDLLHAYETRYVLLNIWCFGRVGHIAKKEPFMELEYI